MDSIKSIVVVAILLGVLYGIYQVINDEDSPVSPRSTNLMAEFDKEDPSDGDRNDGDRKEKGNESSSSPTSRDNPNSNSSIGDTGANSTPQKSVKPPPPSTFSPKSSNFKFPKRKESRETGTTSGNFDPRETTAPPKSKTFEAPDPNDSFRLTRNSKDAFSPPPASSSQGQAFKEIKNGDSRSPDPAVNSGIYQPDSITQENSAAALTSAVSSVNDPRNRFVKGSFADFEKRVLGDMEQAEGLIRKNDFVGALRLLTKFYDDPRLTQEENQNLSSWLDPLAGKVIYSVEPHLVEPYYVRPNDTMNLLSGKFGVPAELLLNINRAAIADPQKLVPGTELKVVKGPFNAEISLSKKKMTLFVNGLYAGNFKIRIGTEPIPKPGKYRVLSKSRLGQDYPDRNNQRIAAASPNNPYGQHYLNLGGDMAIHGSAQVSDSNDRRGCISLNAIDAEDVHNILTTKSSIVIVE